MIDDICCHCCGFDNEVPQNVSGELMECDHCGETLRLPKEAVGQVARLRAGPENSEAIVPSTPSGGTLGPGMRGLSAVVIVSVVLFAVWGWNRATDGEGATHKEQYTFQDAADASHGMFAEDFLEREAAAEFLARRGEQGDELALEMLAYALTPCIGKNDDRVSQRDELLAIQAFSNVSREKGIGTLKKLLATCAIIQIQAEREGDKEKYDLAVHSIANLTAAVQSLSN